MAEQYRGSGVGIPTWVMLMIVLVGPIVEEMFFRGFVLRALLSPLGVIPAILVQAILFAVMHQYGGAGMMVAGMMGVLLGIYTVWRQTLLTSIAVHVSWNGLALWQMSVVVASTPFLGIDFVTHDPGPHLSDRCEIRFVVPNTAAEEVGMRAGDIIYKVEARLVNHCRDVSEIVRSKTAGDTIEVVVHRGDEVVVVRPTLRKREQ